MIILRATGKACEILPLLAELARRQGSKTIGELIKNELATKTASLVSHT